MSLYRVHAAPTEVMLASSTRHIWASTILLHSYTTLWTRPHPCPEQIEVISSLCVIAVSAFMPWLLAFPTCFPSTLSTSHLNLRFPSCSPYLTITAKMWAPNQIWVRVDLARKLISSKLLLCVVIDMFQYNLIV